jgi:hypothetical protein
MTQIERFFALLIGVKHRFAHLGRKRLSFCAYSHNEGIVAVFPYCAYAFISPSYHKGICRLSRLCRHQN